MANYWKKNWVRRDWKMAAIKHNGLSHQGGSCSNSSNGSSNGSVMGDCHVIDGDSSEWVGAPCGQHGTYTFYKAVKISTHRRILALGDFFFVKMWTDQEIVSIGELQLLWEDQTSSSSSPLASLKLYFLPENTPDGRHEEHGEVHTQFQVFFNLKKWLFDILCFWFGWIPHVVWMVGWSSVYRCREMAPPSNSLFKHTPSLSLSF